MPRYTVNTFARQLTALTDGMQGVFTRFSGTGSGRTTSPEMRVLLKASGQMKMAVIAAASPGTQTNKWWNRPYPTYWKWMYASVGSLVHNPMMMRKGRMVTTKGFYLPVYRRGKGERYVRVRDFGAGPRMKGYSHTPRPVGRLRRNILVKPSKAVMSANPQMTAVNTYVRFNKKPNSMWSTNNAFYARFLEMGTADGPTREGKHKQHTGVKTNLGWYHRSIAGSIERALTTVQQDTTSWLQTQLRRL